MTLKDADKIKEAIKKIAPVLARSDDIIKVIDSVPEVVIDTDTDTISRQAAIELCDWYDNPSMREDLEKLRPVFTEIAEEYKKSCEISYINKPLAYALHEVWKKHDRRDTKRNDKRRNESKESQEPSL